MIAETGMSSVYDETLAATDMMSFGKLFHSVGPAVEMITPIKDNT